MKKNYLLLLAVICLFQVAFAQTAWYNTAQARIDTLRKGPFSIKVQSVMGLPIKDSIRIKLKKHAFPWGTAYDLSYGTSTMGTTYSSSTTSGIKSVYGDILIYQSERWGKYVAYELPAVSGKSYKLTLKLAELYFSTAGSRLFDMYIDGVQVMKNVDKIALTSAKFTAIDTTFDLIAKKATVKVEFLATKDNVSVNGLVLKESTGASVLRLNCGGATVNIKGIVYTADNAYLNASSANLIPTTDDWYKANMLKYCNYGVCGNQFKWSGIEPTHAVLNYAPFENTFNWFKKSGWDMRAHTILWGGNNSTDYHCIPQWVMNLSSTPKAMYDTCLMRVKREMTRYKGVVKEYDVLNEPTHANYLQKIVGDSINWNCFKVAHAADPNARLFVNDFNIIEWQDQTNNFVTLVQKMLANGAPITGIGAQCHIGSSVDLTNFKTRFDQLGQFGLPIKITEFDMGAKSLTQLQYAQEISKMMRLAFSHPSIEGFVFWGLTEPTWVPASIVNLIREDQTTKIAADSVYDLVHKLWNTDLSVQTTADGLYAFTGYYGDYDIQVKTGSTWESFDLSCLKADKGKQFTLTLGTGKAVKPNFKSIKVLNANTLQLCFDRKMSNPSANIANFKIFGPKLNYVVAASLNVDDSTQILLTTNAPVSNRDYIPLSYAPGTVTSAEGALLEPFGPILSSDVTPSFLSAKTSTNGKSVLVYFDRKLTGLTVVPQEFLVRRNNQVDTVRSSTLGSTGDYIELTLDKQVTDTLDILTVGYGGGSLKTIENKFVTTFDSNPVQNSISLPSFVSAITSVSGQYLTLSFNQVMADPTGLQGDFTVSTTAQPNIQVTSASLLSTDKTKIKLTLATPIYMGEIVTLTYVPGSLAASSGIPSKSFTSSVSNISYTSLSSERFLRTSPSPNPFVDQVVLEDTEDFTTLLLMDMTGKLVFRKSIQPHSRLVLPVSNVVSGAYLLILQNAERQLVYKIEKNG
jgi:uncharacterized repeat protein (TIGR02059 family)